MVRVGLPGLTRREPELSHGIVTPAIELEAVIDCVGNNDVS